ncbi:MAG: hypothetical protein VX278_17185 [Myxococcota bacterium]|nr:hypothetical protein [Myxococcota bacterium]
MSPKELSLLTVFWGGAACTDKESLTKRDEGVEQADIVFPNEDENPDSPATESTPQQDSKPKVVKVERPIQDSSGLIELRERFGSVNGRPNIVPYYYSMGREASYRRINAAISLPGYGPRTFLRSDIHEIMTHVFEALTSTTHIVVYGEGSWGGEHAKKPLKPHRTHSKGLFLDIFMPVLKNDVPTYFPTSESDLFGYDVDFTPNGIGQGKHTDLRIDWLGLQTLILQICKHGDTKLKKILIAKDMYSFIVSKRKAEVAKIPKDCRNKIKPIPEIGPYLFAGRDLMVDHDDHIHVEFR